MKMIKDGYTELAYRIVEQAVDDWKTANKAVKKSHGDIIARQHMIECEGFFKSEWFSILTDDKIDGRTVIKTLKERGED